MTHHHWHLKLIVITAFAMLMGTALLLPQLVNERTMPQLSSVPFHANPPSADTARYTESSGCVGVYFPHVSPVDAPFLEAYDGEVLSGTGVFLQPDGIDIEDSYEVTLEAHSSRNCFTFPTTQPNKSISVDLSKDAVYNCRQGETVAFNLQ